MQQGKHILIVTQYFYPENFKSNDIAFELTKRGYKVDVLTGIPNYPEGVYYKGYGIFKKRIEKINGVTIYRAFQSPRGRRASGIGLALNYLTFALSSTIWLTRLFWNRYDCILVHEPSPMTQALAGVLLKKLKKIPLHIWVLDIWPDAMSSGGGINNKKILGIVEKFVKWVYNNSDSILISSKGFRPLINKLGDYDSKIKYFPNWSVDMLIGERKEIPTLPEGFKIMMAGNLGSAQTIDCVMNAALLLKNRKDIIWVFVGDGSEKSFIDKFKMEHGLEDTVITLGRYPADYMPSFYEKADAMLITLKSKFPHLKAVVPARLQGYMSSGKPVIGMIDGGSAELIVESDCGFVVPAEDFEALAQTIVEKIIPNKESFYLKGMNGRNYYEAEFKLEKCINNLEQIINS